MKKLVFSLLMGLTTSFVVSAQAPTGVSANPGGLVTMGVRYNPAIGRYEVYATPKSVPASSADNIGPSQITLAVPHGFVVTDFLTGAATDIVPVKGLWSVTRVVDNSSAAFSAYNLPTDFIVFGKATNPAAVTWEKNKPVVLFSFPPNSSACAGNVIRVIDDRITIERNFITGAFSATPPVLYDNSINLVNNPNPAVSNANIENYVSPAAYPNASCVTVSGNVWNDFDASRTKGTNEKFISGTNVGSSTADAIGIQLYVNMADAAGKVLFSAPVAADGSYRFTNVPTGMTGANALQLQLSPTRSVAEGVIPAQGIMDVTLNANNTLPGKWLNVTIAAGAGNGATQGAPTSGVIRLNTPTSGDVIDQNFGIEQTPTADPKVLTAPNSAFTLVPGLINGIAWPLPTILSGGIARGTQSITASAAGLTPLSGGSTVGGTKLSGTDPEDCAGASSCGLASKFKVTAVNANTLLYYYNGTSIIAVPAGTTLSSFNPDNLRIYGQNGQGTAANPLGFSYSLVDAAGQESAPAPYSIQAAGTPLAVKLLSFEAQKEKDNVAITWTTTNEQNNDHFEVMHSANAKDWSKIGIVKGHGTTTETQSYSLMHTSPVAGKNYYRLVQVDMSGAATQSDVRIVTFDGALTAKLSVYPNPASSALYLTGGDGGKAKVSIYNAAGALALQLEVAMGEQIHISGLATGMYEVRMQQGSLLNREKITIMK